jgi:hypothetical protein
VTGADILRLIRVTTLMGVMIWVGSSTVADPDLWGHVRFGRDIVATGTIPSHDLYSFTSDRPWVNHEWLAEVGMYGAYALGGGAGLVALKMSIVAVVLACALMILRRRQWRPVDHDFLIVVLVLGILPRATTVRPQLFSLALFAILLLLLTMADRGKPRLLIAVPFVFAAWANLHGGFIAGLFVLAVWVAARIWQEPQKAFPLIAIGLLSTAATLLTPYGGDLWRFLWSTVRTSRSHIADWRPVYADPNNLFCWLVVLLTALLSMWRVRGRVDSGFLSILLLLCAATLRIGRVDALFAISVVMFLGPSFGRAPRETASPTWRPSIAAMAALILLAGPAVFARRVSCIGPYSTTPGLLARLVNARPGVVGMPEREAAAVLRQQRGRLLVFFDWGEYAIWHFPDLKVSFDGRRETVYSDALIEQHAQFYGGSTALARLWQPDVIWLPTSLATVGLLEREGWHAAFRGPVSTVLVPHAVNTLIDTKPETECRCFPSE